MPGLPPSLSGYMIIGPPRHGGMGTVWPAKQLGTKQIVAIKILGTRHLNDAGRDRFVREVELSAQLQHPNIARIYDSGVHQGDYYYAMEMIDGSPLDRYVEKRKLNQKQILELMRLVCQAVQHAHVRGVIHCDIKPGNILVSGDGQPHILDFGLAKLATGRAEGLTDSGSAPGTPSWMSPEQAGGRLDKIDTRTDVYSLGKILYLLLTGQPPHRTDGPVSDVLHRIAHEEICPPRKACPRLNGELCALLRKALDRDPERRYATGGELARDIEHFQRGQPLVAMPGSIVYQLRKWVGRHWGAFSVAGVVLLAMVSVGIVLDKEMRRQTAKLDKEMRRQTAKKDALGTFNRYVLQRLDPANTGGGDITDDLIKHAKEVSAMFADEPLTQADISEGIAEILLTCGQFAPAEEQYKQAVDLRQRHLEKDHPKMLSAKRGLAQVYRERGNFEESEKICRGILQSRRIALGEEHLETLRAKTTLAYVLIDKGLLGGAAGSTQEAEAIARQTVRQGRERHGAENAETLSAQAVLVMALRHQNDAKKLAEADQLSQTTLDARTKLLGGEHLQTLESLHDRASVLTVMGKPSEAIPMYNDAIIAARRVLARTSGIERGGAEHPDLLIWRSDLAFAQMLKHDFVEAEKIYREILPANIHSRGSQHPYTIIMHKNLATALAGQKKWAGAEWYFEEAAKLHGDLWGAEHPQTLNLLDFQAIAMTMQGKWAEAEKIFLKNLHARLLRLSENDDEVKNARMRLENTRAHLRVAATRPAAPDPAKLENGGP